MTVALFPFFPFISDNFPVSAASLHSPSIFFPFVLILLKLVESSVKLVELSVKLSVLCNDYIVCP